MLILAGIERNRLLFAPSRLHDHNHIHQSCTSRKASTHLFSVVRSSRGLRGPTFKWHLNSIAACPAPAASLALDPKCWAPGERGLWFGPPGYWAWNGPRP